MRVPAYPIVASVILLAAPAFAQTLTNPSAQPAGTSTAPRQRTARPSHQTRSR